MVVPILTQYLSRNTVTWRPVIAVCRQHRILATLPKLFTWDWSYAFSRSTKVTQTLLAYSQDFSPGRKSHRASSRYVEIFRRIFCQAFGIKYSSKASERDAPAVDPFTPVSRFVYGYNHPSLPNFRWPSRTPGQLTHTSQIKTPLFKALSISGRVSSQSTQPSVLWQLGRCCPVMSCLHPCPPRPPTSIGSTHFIL